MSPDYLKLFMDKRLSVEVPHHLEYIKGRLANLNVEDPSAYAEYSAHYGVEVSTKVTKEPDSKEEINETADVEIPKKKGRPAKSSTPS